MVDDRRWRSATLPLTFGAERVRRQELDPLSLPSLCLIQGLALGSHRVCCSFSVHVPGVLCTARATADELRAARRCTGSWC
jgi:hypothetical protein